MSRTDGLGTTTPLGAKARALRRAHDLIGGIELLCLCYLWFCALTRRRDRWLQASVAVLFGEGVALLVARGCPFGVLQRRAGDDVAMFELWFGPRLAPLMIPVFTGVSVAGLVVLLVRTPSAPAASATTAVTTTRETVLNRMLLRRRARAAVARRELTRQAQFRLIEPLRGPVHRAAILSPPRARGRFHAACSE